VGFSASLGAVKAVLQLLPLVLLAMWSGTRLVAVAAITLLPFAVLLSRAKTHAKIVQRRALDESALLLEATDEAIRHAELWSSYRATHRVRDRVARAGRALTQRAASAAAFTVGLSGATEALGALALLLVVVGAHAGVLGASSSDGGRLLAFAVAFFMAYKPVRELVEARLAWARAGAAAERLGVGEPVHEDDGSAAGGTSQTPIETLPCALSPLELRGVVLERGKLGAIDARIEPGSIVAIRGATGVGKTTLLRTLLGFARLRAGEIRHGGPLATGSFAWVPQDAPIVRGTLAENVALGGTGDVRAAMDAIGAADLFERLGEAQLGVGGRALSGGEQKQVAIARALATHKPILLLDEPTSGLDDGAQAAVLAAIARLRGKRTVLIVTHRPEPLAIADAVLSFGLTEPSTEVRAARGVDPPAP
jgi:ABC-type multidrug transport system fused ATPase/permease subunit